jgi:hypothetical protein
MELGYVCCNAPLLLTTSSAEYGRLIPSYRGVPHHSFTAWTCSSKRASSAGPILSAVESSWNESEGRAVDTGGWTGGNGALSILGDNERNLDWGRVDCRAQIRSCRGNCRAVVRIMIKRRTQNGRSQLWGVVDDDVAYDFTNREVHPRAKGVFIRGRVMSVKGSRK